MKTTKSSLRDLAISDSGLVFDPTNGTIATSNPIGLEVLRAFIQGESLQDIQERLILNYDAHPKTIERDLNDFVIQLKGYGYLHE